MTDVLKPRDAKEVEEAVRWALGNDKALEVAGQGTKRAIGRPSQTDLTLDLSGLSGVTLYEPAELVLSAKPARRLPKSRRCSRRTTSSSPSSRWITARCSAAKPGRARIGGAIAANLSGPRRIKAGAARDHFLGVTAVTGRGETIKSGGRVVKNVTGYDMCKVLAGSWGTLAAMTDVTVKVLPKAGDRSDRHRRRPRRRARLRRHGRGHGLVLRCLRRGASARPCGVLFRRPAQAGSRHRAAAGRLRALGRAPQGGARRADEAVRPGRAARRKELARALAQRAAGQAVCRRGGARAPALAHFDRARQGPRDRGRDHAGGADVLRLGRRADLGGDAVRRRARRRLDPRRGRGARRPRHAGARARLGARCGRCVRAAGGRPARA